MNVEHW